MEPHRDMTLALYKRRMNSSGPIILDGKSLTTADLSRMATEGPRPLVKIHHACQDTMQKNRDYFEEVMDSGAMIYGINTGYGGSADVRNDDTKKMQRSLIRHLNAGFASYLPSGVIRAVMVIRANALVLGYSGVRPGVVELLLDMINNDIVPRVPVRGSVSASGDLMPLSYICAAMMGREDSVVYHKGEEMRAPEALRRAGLTPVVFLAKEALGVLNAASLSASVGGNVLYNANMAALMTQLATAFTVEALHGHLESFDPVVHECLSHQGQQEVARNLRRFLKGSKFAVWGFEVDKDDTGEYLKQDRYALRTATQWLAPVTETLIASTKRINVEINSANDNPIIDHRARKIVHCGNFQGTSISVAMDQARQSLQLCGKLLFAQMSEVVNVKLNQGLPPNLCGSDPTTDFGFKGCDTAMASYSSELDLLCNPVTNHVLSAELHNQSVNSMALLSARKSEEALWMLRMMISNLTCALAQAVDLRWLQLRVQEQLEIFMKDNGMNWWAISHHKYSWHSFCYDWAGTIKKMETDLFFGGRKFVDNVGESIASVRQEVKDGKHFDDICGCLGTGTGRLYRFIRRDLGIPFNTGEDALDVQLNKMFHAINNHQLDDVVAEVFAGVDSML